MYIVHVVRQFHPGVGGLENVVLELATAQATAGHRIRVVTLDRLFTAIDKKLPPIEWIANIEIVRIPYSGSTRYPLAWSVLKHIKDADIVHVHAIDFFFDYLAWTKPIHGRRLVVSTHGGFFHTGYAALLKRLWFATITRLSTTWYGAVIAVSASDYELFRRIRSNGLVCIENGANISKFRGLSSTTLRKSIVSIGRFSNNKRLDLLIGFMRALTRRDPEWRLTIAGRPSDLQAKDIAQLVDAAGLRETIDVVASPSDERVTEMMRNSSFVASASEYEGFGVAAVEGLAAGLIPLLSDIPPFRRLVARAGTGIVIDFSKPDQGVVKTAELLENVSVNYGQHRTACMNAAAAFDWPDVSREYARLYDEVTGAHTRTLLGVPIQVCTFDEAVALVDKKFLESKRFTVAFTNANTMNIGTDNTEFRETLNKAVVFNDGIGLDIASRLLYGSPFPENLNGTDFVPNYLQKTRNRYRVFLLGAKAGIAEKAMQRLSTLCPHHHFVGVRDGHFPREKTAEVIRLVQNSRADVLLVAMGNPIQELFLRDHLAATGCTLGIGVGALFDFLAGEVPRAPDWIQKARMEWLYRLAQEPRRLARRYLLGNPLFLWRVFRQWCSGARVRNVAPDASSGKIIQPAEPMAPLPQAKSA